MQADIPRTTAALRALKGMQKEALLQGSLQHPNVLGLVGAVQQGHAFAGFIMPFCQGGSLETALRELSTSNTSLPLPQRVRVALLAARGLSYLHQRSIIHLDLKADNIFLEGPLLTSNGADVDEAVGVKIADFGLSTTLQPGQTSVAVNQGRGTDSHMAPEVRRGGNVSTSADIWSFGVLLWELVHQRPPGPDDSTGSNRVPIVPPDCQAAWAVIMKKCLRIRASERPDASQLVQELQQLL
ncbi:hypothetical protein WJX74_010980 [Apatococcus lobatus]|uniref:Protein kinase domain-containing protein n=1 Tax=Apatococcus lobatus TaxID=904363 RepID=A0AAW1QXY9_9CHLO